MQPTPLRGPKIVDILQASFVLTPVPIYTAARLMRNPLGRHLLCIDSIIGRRIADSKAHHPRKSQAMRIRHLTIGLSVIVLVMLALGIWSWISHGACFPNQLHCGTLGKPQCPQLMLPANTQDLQMEMQEHGYVRLATFQSQESPEEIKRFYSETLITQDWGVEKGSDPILHYAYVNGAGNPAFGLDIEVVTMPNGSTMVKMYRVQSGPFAICAI